MCGSHGTENKTMKPKPVKNPANVINQNQQKHKYINLKGE